MQPKIYFKQVAVINQKYFSIYDKNTEYIIGFEQRQEPRKNHKGGFFVYPTLELAAKAEISLKLGSNWIFPRRILKVECWGSFIQYPRFKICFEYIKPIEDLGFPHKYLSPSSFKEKQEVSDKKDSHKSRLKEMKKETENLEFEVLMLENKAKMMGINI